MARKPTIYEALVSKLGRHPTNAELKAEVQRIKREAWMEVAQKGKLPYQTGNPTRAVSSQWRKAKIRRLSGGKVQVKVFGLGGANPRDPLSSIPGGKPLPEYIPGGWRVLSRGLDRKKAYEQARLFENLGIGITRIKVSKHPGEGWVVIGKFYGAQW